MASAAVVVAVARTCELGLLGNRELAIDHGFTLASGGMALALLGLFADLVSCLLCVEDGLVDLGAKSLLMVAAAGVCLCDAVVSDPRGL